MENSEKVTDLEAAVKSLQDQVKSKTTEVDTLRGKTRLLEKTQADKFEREKDKIVKVLEASFGQRLQVNQAFFWTFGKKLKVKKTQKSRKKLNISALFKNISRVSYLTSRRLGY